MSQEPVTKRPAAHRHRSHAAVNSRPKRNPFALTPLVAGVIALGLAAGGAVVATNSGSTDSQYTRTSSEYDATDYRRNDPEVSRGVDREVLARQAQQQAEQRTAALAALDKGSKLRNKTLKKVAVKRERAKAAQVAQVANQWVLPMAGYRLTARFGESSSLWSTVHTGLDFAAPEGTKIVSVAQGTVTKVGNAGAYGNQTIVTLEDGTDIWYNHQSATQVSVGQKVDPGEAIGSVGSTGNVTGPHLHLEVRPGGGEPVDPFAELTKHNVKP